jgi:hypothetical protein
MHGVAGSFIATIVAKIKGPPQYRTGPVKLNEAISDARASWSLHRYAGCRHRCDCQRRRCCASCRLLRHGFRHRLAGFHHHRGTRHHRRRCNSGSAENKNVKVPDSCGSARSTCAAASCRRCCSSANSRTSAAADCRIARYCSLALTAAKPGRLRFRTAHYPAPTADDSHLPAPSVSAHSQCDSSFRSQQVPGRDPWRYLARPRCVNYCRRAVRGCCQCLPLGGGSAFPRCWAYCPDARLSPENCGKTNWECSNADSWQRFPTDWPSPPSVAGSAFPKCWAYCPDGQLSQVNCGMTDWNRSGVDS